MYKSGRKITCLIKHIDCKIIQSFLISLPFLNKISYELLSDKDNEYLIGL